MLAIFYTGDKRHNLDITRKNHQLLFDKLAEICNINVYWFTKDDPVRGLCPYEEGDIHNDHVYRRGQGGGIQLWDFVQSCKRTSEPYVLRMRTDTWFTDSSITIICQELREIIEGRSDIVYFGSDWIHENAGKIYEKLVVIDGVAPGVQDFAILANRSKLKEGNIIIDYIDKLNAKKRRSGNNLFKLLIPMHQLPDGSYVQEVQAYRILCQIWLVRQTYNEYPDNEIVCRDYIQSYIADGKSEMGKKAFITPHPMQPAINWWRSQKGWNNKDLVIGDWTAWQSE